MKQSEQIKVLANTIDTLQESFDEEILEKLEQEKLILDERVDNSRYGYIVTRKDYYQSLIKKMEDLSL